MRRARPERQQERRRAHELGREGRELGATREQPAHEAEPSIGQVAQASVQQLRGARAGPGGERRRFDERGDAQRTRARGRQARRARRPLMPPPTMTRSKRSSSPSATRDRDHGGAVRSTGHARSPVQAFGHPRSPRPLGASRVQDRDTRATVAHGAVRGSPRENVGCRHQRPREVSVAAVSVHRAPGDRPRAGRKTPLRVPAPRAGLLSDNKHSVNYGEPRKSRPAPRSRAPWAPPTTPCRRCTAPAPRPVTRA